MPAEAGIQSVGETNNFKELDSRFRGNDDVFLLVTQSLAGESQGGELDIVNLRDLLDPLKPRSYMARF